MADDYTPSVDEARERYIDVCRDTDHCRLCDEVGAEFDRMIEAVRAEEREKADREPSEDYPDAEGLAALRANREPSDAEVEAAAKAMPCRWSIPMDEHPTDPACRPCRHHARAALLAARIQATADPRVESRESATSPECNHNKTKEEPHAG